MFEFESLQIENVVTHENTKIEFLPGISVIRGENATGKSVMFQAMTKLITNSLPHAQKKSERELGGKARVVFRKDGIKYDIELDLAKNKYSVVKNNKLTEYRKATTSQLAVANIFPWSVDAWQNFVYVSSDTFPILLKGKASQRRSVFEDLFNIDTSRQHKLVRKMLRNLEKYTIREKALKEAAGDIGVLSLKGLAYSYRQNIDRFKSDLRALEEELTGAEPSSKLWSNLVARFPMLDKINSKRLVEIIKDVEFAQDHLELIKTEIHVKEGKILAAELKKKLKGFNPDDLLSPDEVTRHDAIIENRNGIFACEGIKPVEEPDYDKQDEYITAKNLLSSKSNHLAKCPTCRQKVDPKYISTMIDFYTAELKKLDKQTQDYQKYKKLKKYIDYFESEYGFKLPGVDAIEASEIKIAKHEKAVTFKADAERLKKVEEFLKKSKNMDFGAIYLDKKEVEELLDLSRSAGPLLEERLGYLNRKSKARPADEIREDIDSVKHNIRLLEQDLAQTQAKIIANKAYQKARIKRLLTDIRKKPLKLMERIYGPKGLRLAATKHVLANWLSEMNSAARDAYGKGYEFSAEMDSSGVHIYCERDRAGQKLFSDVRRLSGYESKMFPVASLLSMAKILPDELRTNILVLDEIEANMSAMSRKKLLAMLPELQKVYPCICIVTPTTIAEFPIDLPDIDVYEYRVELSNGKSKLVEV